KTREIEAFRPRHGGKVLYYTCGPSIYNFAHLGNLRTFFWEDELKRALIFNGYKVSHAMPISDIEDKSIAAFNSQKNRDFEGFIRPKIARFKRDMSEMNIIWPTHIVRFKSAIPAVKEWIGKIQDNGFAYPDGKGNLLFNARKIKGYGSLVRLDAKKRRKTGTRLDDDYSKEGIYDFALWKAADKNDGQVKWRSPWGTGRPGTHAYCSAIAYNWLGKKIDIHAGGVDNIFPHHENEMAQSACVAGNDFVKYWFHVRHLTIGGKKMSKSLGNAHYLKDVAGKGIGGQDLRYFYLKKHYRKNQNFDFQCIKAAKQVRRRLASDIARIKKAKPCQGSGGKAEARIAKDWARMMAAVGKDLNVPRALEIFEKLVADMPGYCAGTNAKRLFLERASEFGFLTGLELI
ncbi:MAG TPA: class I tRNA ligase family protein, partial [Candidatus Micrarchaeota archaeon]|nr:class I tRNA ligase family protein [Candidatus Micrarchaeota archaeon]